MMLSRRSLLAGTAGLSAAAVLTRPSFAKTGGSIAPEDFGAAGDGVSDDLEAWNKAVARSAETGAVIVPTAGRTYKIGDTLKLTQGARIAGPARAATLIAPKGGVGLMIQSDVQLSGLSIVNDPKYHMQQDAKAGVMNNVKVSGMAATGGVIGFATFGFGTINTGIELTDCTYDGVQNPVLLGMAKDSRIHGNRYKGASGANVCLRMGSGNIIQNETIEGGRTGIVLLPSFKMTKFGCGTFENNIITGNTISDVREEFISFDCNGTIPESSVRETAAIAETSDRDPDFFTMRLGGDWQGAGASYARAYACIMTGKAAGAVVRADEAEDGTLYFRKGATMAASLFGKMRRGDVVVLGLPFIDNLVSKNVVKGATGSDKLATGIYLFNLCFHNKVEDNDVTLERTGQEDLCRGISIRSSNGYSCQESFASRDGSMCALPSIGNEIRHNTVRGSDIVLDFHSYNGGAPFVSGQNRVEDNTIIGGRLIIEGHEALEARNAITR